MRGPSPIQRLRQTHGVAAARSGREHRRPRTGARPTGTDPGRGAEAASGPLPPTCSPASPHLPNAEDEAQSPRARRGRERPRPRAQEGPSGPEGLRPASGHEEKPRALEARKPRKKAEPAAADPGGGGRIPRLLSCITPPRPESRGPGPGRGDRPRSRRWIGGKSSITETTTNRGTGPGGSPL
ncbi:hypothetical protein NDU88_001268 [Pleurodeles waltl]|uniref:Uncharacterized protein n=1 Tax=Pleurodeles waltl TaxID=8319 RepID=A0AAV7NIH7_PLEWA|nr:hypothetical protein NDU88_001268 [Pleurodeles waltl]